MLTGLREDLDQAATDPLSSHLHQTQRGHLGDLVLGAVPSQALEHPAHDKVPVALEHHVDEVDDDDAADVTQPQLSNDLLGCLDVVLGDRFLEVAARADELARVDVDHGHRLGPVDDQGTTRRQPDLAIHGLGDLLVHPVVREEVLFAGPFLDPAGQIRCHRVDITVDRLPGGVTGDDQTGEVLVEHISDDADGEVGLAVQQGRSTGALALGLDLLPRSGQPCHVGTQLVLTGALSRRADDDSGVVRDDVAQDLLQTGPLGVRELARDAHHVAVRHIDQVATGQRDLRGQSGALVSDGVLRDLDKDALPRAQRILDPPGPVVLQPCGIPVDLTGVQHRVAAPADIGESSLHARQDVLDPGEVDVAGHRGVDLAGHVVLDQDTVLEDADLGAVLLVAHHHDPLNAFAPGQELRLGDDRATTARLTTLTTTLFLGLQPGRTLDRRDLIVRLTRLPDPRRGAG